MINKKIVAGIVATIAASLCCVVPLLAILAGSSSLATSFAWMEPYHDFLFIFTVFILLYAWWEKLKPKKDTLDCACDAGNKINFFSSKMFLALVTLFVIVMFTFPKWGYAYFEVENSCNSCTNIVKEEKKDELPVLRLCDKNGSSCTAKATCSGIGYKEADALLNTAREEVKEMAPKDLQKMLDNEEDFILLDVREKEQRAEGEIYASDTLAITRGDLEFEVMNKIKNKDATIVVYCRLGGRSLFAAQTLMRLGYTDVYNLGGGLKAWAKAGLPFDNGLGIVVKVEEE